MTLIWIVIAVVVVIAAVLIALEVHAARRRRSLAHLEPTDPSVAVRAMAEADANRTTAEGLSKSAHPGISGGAGTLPGA